jgi:hypothetical protein
LNVEEGEVLIEKIDVRQRVNAIDGDGLIVYDQSNEQVSRPMNNVEYDVVSKINEIVDIFNEGEKRVYKDHYSFIAIQPKAHGMFPCTLCGSYNTKWKMIIIGFSGCKNYCDNCCELKKNELNGDVRDAE